MAFQSMWSELLGMVPKFPLPLAKTLINRAYRDVRRQNLWSFLLYDGPQWITPPMVNGGTATCTRGSNQVVLDATAAALAAACSTSYSSLLQRQFRIPASTIYNIWGWDNVDTLTLDRPFGEVSGAYAYQILQVYYAAPYLDHQAFLSIRNMTTWMDLCLTKSRIDLDGLDPQRSMYYFPTDAVYYQQDQNPNSPTYQFPMYELWGVPQAAYNYQLYGVRKGVDLVAKTDQLPPAIGEDCVVELAKVYAFQYAEAHKDLLSRGGPDFKFLMGASLAEYKRLFKEYRKQDRELVDNWCFNRKLNTGLASKLVPHYSSVSGMASPGL